MAGGRPSTGRRAGPRTTWISGLVIGVIGGAALLVFPALGIGVLIAMLLGVVRAGSPMAGLGGLLAGVGLGWTLLFGRVKLTCTATQPDGSSCVAPTIDAYLVLAVALLVIGVGVSIGAALVARRRLG